MSKKAKPHQAKTGIYVLYMSFRLIHWKENKNEDKTPLLLVPVENRKESEIFSYRIVINSDDIIVYPTFSYIFTTIYGFRLPEYSGESFYEYLAIAKERLKDIRGEKLMLIVM